MPEQSNRRRRLIVALLILVVVAAGGVYVSRHYYFIKTTLNATESTLRVNVIEPSNLKADESFKLGLKPEWWHDQWLIIPTATPAQRTIVLRCLYKHSWLGGYVSKIEIGCMGHDPMATKDLEAYGIEDRPEEVRLKEVPPSVLLGGQLVDFSKWFPGSYQ